MLHLPCTFLQTACKVSFNLWFLNEPCFSPRCVVQPSGEPSSSPLHEEVAGSQQPCGNRGNKTSLIFRGVPSFWLPGRCYLLLSQHLIRSSCSADYFSSESLFSLALPPALQSSCRSILRRLTLHLVVLENMLFAQAQLVKGFRLGSAVATCP